MALEGRADASRAAAREVIPPIVPTGWADEWLRAGDERFCKKTQLETFFDNCLQLLLDSVFGVHEPERCQ